MCKVPLRHASNQDCRWRRGIQIWCAYDTFCDLNVQGIGGRCVKVEGTGSGNTEWHGRRWGNCTWRSGLWSLPIWSRRNPLCCLNSGWNCISRIYQGFQICITFHFKRCAIYSLQSTTASKVPSFSFMQMLRSHICTTCLFVLNNLLNCVSCWQDNLHQFRERSSITLWVPPP